MKTCARTSISDLPQPRQWSPCPPSSPRIFRFAATVVALWLTGCGTPAVEGGTDSASTRAPVTRGEGAQTRLAATKAPGGLSLICTTSRGLCFNQRPLASGQACTCADAASMVAGRTADSVPVNTTPDLAAVVDVFFATDRNRTASNEPSRMFGATRAAITYGVARVSIPATHQTGYLEAPSTLVRLRFLENAKRHVLVLEANELSNDAYFANVQGRLSSSPREDAFIFVHGFNATFEDGVRRTGQIAYDLGFRGAPVLYSWPSKGSPTPLGYAADSQMIEWSTEVIKTFIEDFLNKTSAKNIYLIAHSMGTQALTRSLISLVGAHPEMRSRIKEIILAAPDIDAGIFKRDIAPVMVNMGRPITLYASSEDRALKLSRLAHDYPRAGDSGAGLVLVKGIETIDATDVDTSFLGHSTFAEAREVLTDWRFIIDRGLRANERGLRQVSSEVPYWQFAK